MSEISRLRETGNMYHEALAAIAYLSSQESDPSRAGSIACQALAKGARHEVFIMLPETALRMPSPFSEEEKP